MLVRVCKMAAFAKKSLRLQTRRRMYAFANEIVFFANASGKSTSLHTASLRASFANAESVGCIFLQKKASK